MTSDEQRQAEALDQILDAHQKGTITSVPELDQEDVVFARTLVDLTHRMTPSREFTVSLAGSLRQAHRQARGPSTVPRHSDLWRTLASVLKPVGRVAWAGLMALLLVGLWLTLRGMTGEVQTGVERRTGIDEVDTVIDIFLARGLEERLSLVRYTVTVCTTAEGLGGPPKCRESEEKGTVVEAFPVLSSEGYHLRPNEVASVLSFDAARLLAVYEVPDGTYEAEYWPAGEYGLLFAQQEAPHPISVLVSDGQIVRVVEHLGQTPEEVAEQYEESLILAPEGEVK